MVSYRKKKKITNRISTILFSALLVIIFSVLAVFLLSGNIKIYKKRNQLSSQITAFQKEIKHLSQEKEKFEEGISGKNQQHFLENAAREQFGLRAPGEEVVVISKEENEEESAQTKEKEGPEKWWEWLKSKVRD